MNSESRHVFDTNVIISALPFSTSVPGRAFRRWLDLGTMLISHPLVEEPQLARSSHHILRAVDFLETKPILRIEGPV
jgi:hypothetical protein